MRVVIWEGERFEASVVKASRRIESEVVWANVEVVREVRAKRMEMEVGTRILKGYAVVFDVDCFL